MDTILDTYYILHWIYIAYEVCIQMVPANEYVKYTIVQFIRQPIYYTILGLKVALSASMATIL